MPLLEACSLGLTLPDRSAKRWFGRPPCVSIFRNIGFELEAGETLGVVGESGSGKTSLGRTCLRLYQPTSGRLLFEGQDISNTPERDLRHLRSRMQIAFQDPQSALNPRHRIEDILAQPYLSFGRSTTRREGRSRAAALLEQVGLPGAFGRRYPHQLSGGQRQRVGIARAIALKPALLVADEIVSGLDVSTQAQILALLRDLRKDLGLTLIFISHDLSVIRVLCNRVLVMRQGEAIEAGSCSGIFAAPRHPYTRELLGAIPLPEVDPGWVERQEPGFADTITPSRKALTSSPD